MHDTSFTFYFMNLDDQCYKKEGKESKNAFLFLFPMPKLDSKL